ncbi:hypothetical protein BH23GEM9_BH23GEM9_15940 [soil metagenome]
MTNPAEERFTDDEVKRALKRAIELDAAGSLTTRQDLYAVAAELGIPKETIDAALAESSVAVRESDLSDTARRERLATTLAALGLPLGVAAGSILVTMPFFTATGIFGLVAGAGFLVSGGILIVQGAKVSLRSFTVRNTALWAGFVVGNLAAIAVLGAESVPELSWLMVMSQGVRRLLASTIIGAGAVIAIRNALRAPDTDDNGAAPVANWGQEERSWTRPVAILRRWFVTNHRVELRAHLMLRKLSAIRDSARRSHALPNWR